MHKFKILNFFLIILFLFANFSYGKQIPTKKNGFEYFFVFGKNGKSGYGATDNISIFFITIPENIQKNLMIKIFDPNVGGRHDEREKAWNSSTKFSIYGGKKAFSNAAARQIIPEKGYDSGRLLYEKKFDNSQLYDDHWIYVGPFNPQQGEHIGKYYIFKVIVEGLEGNDNNLFKMDISPKNAEIFSYNISLRLPKTKSKRVKLYPFIPKGVKNLRVSNFDLDISGGNITLYSPNQKYNIKKSYSGKYRITDLNIKNSNKLQKWELQILKVTQKEGNVSLSLKDSNGRPLRIYLESKRQSK